MTRETEVLIVGGGPAGLAAAIAARKKGFEVTVVDGARPPIDKACGEGVMPDGVALLGELGVELAEDEVVPFRGIRFAAGGLSAWGLFPESQGLGIRRTTLHRAMVRRAGAVGVDLLWGTRVRGLSSEAVVTDGGRIRARWIVAADGGGSFMRRWAGLDRPYKQRRRVGIRRHYEVMPWTDYVEVLWGDGCEAYITPVGAGEVCVAILLSDPRLRFQEALSQFPSVEHRFRRAPVSSRQRGAPTAYCRYPAVVRGRIALVGDASGSVDAITGDGLSLAFHQAFALAEALETGNLHRYERAHRRIVALPGWMTQLLLTIDDHPRLRQRALRALAREPDLFSRLLAIHTRAISPMDLGATGAVRLGWRLLTA